MVPNGWEKKTIDNILVRKSDPVNVSSSEEYHQIGIRSHGKGIFYKEPVSGESLGNKRVFWIHPNCFIVNIVFGWEQAVAVTTTDDLGKIASHRFPMYRPKNNACDVKYIEYFFKTKYGKYLLELASPGGAGRNKTLGQKNFSELILVLPPVEEQQKIVDILSTWDRAIEVTKKLIDNSQHQKKALIQQLLTGKKRLKGFTKNWKFVKFDDVLKIDIGGTPSRNRCEYWDNDKSTNNRWVSIRDMKKTRITQTKEHLTDFGAQNCNANLIPAETVIMSFKLTIGKAAILAHSSYTNEAIAALIPRKPEDISRDFLFHSLKVVNFDKEIDQAVKGKTLNKEKLKRLRIGIPNYIEQTAIAERINAANQLIDKEREALKQLRAEKSALMQQLMTGKRRVQTDVENVA